MFAGKATSVVLLFPRVAKCGPRKKKLQYKLSGIVS